MIKEYKITVNGRTYEVTVEEGQASQPVSSPDAHKIIEKAPAAVPAPSAALSPDAPSLGGSEGAIESPMPGKILKVLVSEGDKVKQGQLVMVLEAMKMENEIFSTADGTVSKIIAKEGSSVNTGDALLIIAQGA